MAETGHRAGTPPRNERIRHILEALEGGVEERHEAIRLAFLATLAGESMFFLGPPGVAKSLVARRIKFAFRDARSFEYLMGRFSTPEEIFGPISIQKLKNEDSYERITDSYLPGADIVFLDEIWKASPPIQNALLTALNERTFRNGAREIRIPMKGLLAAANELPEQHASVQAFWDRFLLRLELRPVQEDEAFRRMVLDTEDEYRDPLTEELKLTPDEYRAWQGEIAAVQVPEGVLSAMVFLRRRIAAVNAELESRGEAPIYISDRRWKKMVRILRTSAFLNGRDSVNLLDVLLLQHCLWSSRAQRDVVPGVLEEALHHAQPDEAVNPRRVARELGALRREIRESRLEFSEESRREPVIYRNEYVRLEGLGEPELALVWHGDLEDLRVRSESGADAEVEVFYYGEDATLSRSETLPARLEDWAVFIDGERYPVETREQVDSVAMFREPSESERTAWLKRLNEIDADAERAIGRARERREEAHSGALNHLFVHRSYAGQAYASLDHASRQLRRLRLALGKTRDALDSGGD